MRENRSDSLFNVATLSDVTIRQIYNGKATDYHAHRAILASESKYFRNAFTGPFKEATESVMEMHDDDPDLFPLMLRYIYDGEYRVRSTKGITEYDDALQQIMEDHISLYQLGDKYMLPSLQEKALHEFIARSKLEDYRPPPVQSADEERVFSIIPLYYEACPRPGTPMGLAISSAVRELLKWGNRVRLEPRIVQIADQFHHFALDWVKTTCEPKGFRVHCWTCDTDFWLDHELGTNVEYDCVCPYCGKKKVEDA